MNGRIHLIKDTIMVNRHENPTLTILKRLFALKLISNGNFFDVISRISSWERVA